MTVRTSCDGDVWSFAHFNVWLREKTVEVKALKLVQFAQRAPAPAFWPQEMLVCPEAAPSLGFSEALYPEGCSARAPGPRLDGGEWRPGSDGPEPWLLPPTSPGREEWQPGGGHQDRWRAVSIPWVDGSPGRRRSRCYPPNCLCTRLWSDVDEEMNIAKDAPTDFNLKLYSSQRKIKMLSVHEGRTISLIHSANTWAPI